MLGTRFLCTPAQPWKMSISLLAHRENYHCFDSKLKRCNCCRTKPHCNSEGPERSQLHCSRYFRHSLLRCTEYVTTCMMHEP